MSKSYDEYCGLARALDVVGQRWSLLIVRNLLLGPRRYGELHVGLPGITTNLLAARLRSLEEHEVIVKVDVIPGVGGYALSERGKLLEPAILALGRFGQQDLKGGPRKDDHVDIAWGMVSLKRRYQGRRSGTVQLHIIDGPSFWIHYTSEYVDIQRAEHPAKLVIRGKLASIKRVLFMQKSPNALAIEGPWDHFAESFGLALANLR